MRGVDVKKRSIFDNYGYTTAHNLVNYLAFASITYWLTEMNKETFFIERSKTHVANTILQFHFWIAFKC